MKINITVDVQDIFDCTNEQAYHDGERGACGEGFDINEHIKSAVINGILDRVSKECIDAVMKKANEQVNAALSSAILQAVNAIEDKSVEYAENWLLGENVEVTDKWGQVKEKTSIKAVIARAYEDTLNRKVNGEGRFTDYNGIRLVDYISKKHIEEVVSQRLPRFESVIDKAIKEKLEAQTTNLIAKKIKAVIGE